MYKQTVLHYIQEYAQTQPDTLAVCELRKTVTYAEERLHTLCRIWAYARAIM